MADPNQTSELVRGLGKITTYVMTWAVPLAAIGTVSMALLQTAKNLLPLRSWFQRTRLRAWFKARVTGSSEPESKATSTVTTDTTTALANVEEAIRDLINLAASGDQDALYDLPIEEMCAKIKDVVSVVLDYPKLHIHLLSCLASEATAEDIKILMNPPPLESLLKRPDQSTEDEQHAVRNFAAAKSRVGVQIRSSVDAIQTLIGFRWKFCLQLASVVLSALLGAAALQLGIGPGQDYPKLETTLIIAVLAGFLAPVARDLVAALEKLRS